MPTRMFPKVHVTTVLLVQECVRVRDYATASLWRSPSGFCFTVPREGAGESCDEKTFNALYKEVELYGHEADGRGRE
jgi:hypothetical protein